MRRLVLNLDSGEGVTFKPPGMREQRALDLQTLANEHNPVVKQDLNQPLTHLDQ